MSERLTVAMKTLAEREHPSPPDFSAIHPALQKQAEEDWDVGHIVGVLVSMVNHDYMGFVASNFIRLRARGLLEEAFVTSYTGINFKAGSLPHWDDLRLILQFADRRRLLKAGDPLPGKNSFKVYRGVADGSNKEYVHGLSWTASPAVASWFAHFWSARVEDADPAVFEYEVKPERVFFYSNEREEQEFVVDIPPQARPRRLLKLPKPRPEQTVDEKRAKLAASRATGQGETTDFKKVLAYARAQFRCGADSIHGFPHWRNVDDNARFLCPDTGADLSVARLFAFLHDIRRLDDGDDLDHGKRSANELGTIPTSVLKIDPAKMQLLDYAIRHHTDGSLSDDPTIS